MTKPKPRKQAKPAKRKAVCAMPPNPGSDAAIAGGCACAVMDNHHGQGFPYWTGKGNETITAFYINAACQMHGGGQMQAALAGSPDKGEGG